jgi:NADH-quinone oxidoreductase subunit G
LRGGDPGARLLEASGTLAWFSDIPPAFAPEPGVWRIMPLPHIFGGEELSSHAPPIAERLLPLRALLNPLDAEALGVDDGGMVEIRDLAGVLMMKIPVRIATTLPCGLLGIPRHPGMDLLESRRVFVHVEGSKTGG